MTPTWQIALYAAPFVALLAGLALGRLTSREATRARRLGAELEGALKETELLRAELAASREEQADYQRKVSDHMVGTVDRLRDLALQYRAVYDHLAEGAQELCPERFPAIQSPMDTDLLTEGSSEAVRPEGTEPSEGGDAPDRPDEGESAT